MSRPDDFERLDDYVSGHLDDAEAARLEEQLFAAAAAGNAAMLRRFDALTTRLHELGARGTFAATVTPAYAEEYQRLSKLRVTVYAYPDKVDVDALLARTDITFIKLPVDLRDVDRVDLEMGTRQHPSVKVMPEVDFTPDAGCIVMCCEHELATQGLSKDIVTTVVGYKGGERKVLGVFSRDEVHVPGFAR